MKITRISPLHKRSFSFGITDFAMLDKTGFKDSCVYGSRRLVFRVRCPSSRLCTTALLKQNTRSVQLVC